MKTKVRETSLGESDRVVAMPEPALRRASGSDEGIDLSLLEDSLSKTPWERMQANDDALRFADSLRAAMQERNAKAFSVNPKSSEHCLAGSPELLEPAILIP